MARNQRKYNTEYKVQAVKLSNEIGSSKAAVDEPFPKKWTRKMRKKQNEANRSE